MTDISTVIVSTESSFMDVAKQASGLAIGLQNAAPGDKINSPPNKSVQYLFDIAEVLNVLTGKCKKLLAHGSQEEAEKLHALALEALQNDNDLREKYQIGDKFRFIRERLTATLAHVEEMLNSIKVNITQTVKSIAEDEMLVYIYLFNAQGITLQTWQKMVNQSVFYEYSVNRPIYIDKAHIEAFINRKANKVQHGYVSVIIKKQDVLTVEGGELLKDMYDHPIIKVREGSLHLNKLIAFTHNSIDYTVNEHGELTKKTL